MEGGGVVIDPYAARLRIADYIATAMLMLSGMSLLNIYILNSPPPWFPPPACPPWFHPPACPAWVCLLPHAMWLIAVALVVFQAFGRISRRLDLFTNKRVLLPADHPGGPYWTWTFWAALAGHGVLFAAMCLESWRWRHSSLAVRLLLTAVYAVQVLQFITVIKEPFLAWCRSAPANIHQLNRHVTRSVQVVNE